MAVLCFESGGTKLVAGLADAEGKLFQRKVIYRNPGQAAEETVVRLCELGLALLKEGPPVHAVGFGFGGGVRRSDQRPLLCFHEDGWGELDACGIFRETFKVPVFIENDCNLAALAEALVGFRAVQGTLLYLTLGTGIGAGIVHNGKLLQLGDLGEAEIGHFVVDPSGPECGCGNRGCLEMLCSGPGLANLSRIVSGASIDAKNLMKRFRESEPEATVIVRRAAQYMALALGPTINLLVPNIIVLGGGVMTDNTSFLGLIQNETLKLVFPPFRKTPPLFHLSRLKEDVVCQGAALYALQQLRELEPLKKF